MYISGSFNNYWNKQTRKREIYKKLPYFRNCSMSSELKERGKIDERFEIMLSNLTLEELIALKLEQSSKSLNGKLTGFPVYEVLNEIVEDSVLKFVFSSAENHTEAQMYLGMSYDDYHKLCKKYNVIEYFSENKRSTNEKKAK